MAIDRGKLRRQRADKWYNIAKDRKIGQTRYVMSCDKTGEEGIVSTCPICSGRLKHNGSYEKGIVCRCRTCDAEFIIKVTFKGDLWENDKKQIRTKQTKSKSN